MRVDFASKIKIQRSLSTLKERADETKEIDMDRPLLINVKLHESLNCCLFSHIVFLSSSSPCILKSFLFLVDIKYNYYGNNKLPLSLYSLWSLYMTDLENTPTQRGWTWDNCREALWSGVRVLDSQEALAPHFNYPESMNFKMMVCYKANKHHTGTSSNHMNIIFFSLTVLTDTWKK